VVLRAVAGTGSLDASEPKVAALNDVKRNREASKTEEETTYLLAA
jgi:hypothetical protein